MGFNFDAINGSVGNHVGNLDNQIRDFADTMDPNNTGDMIKMQSMMQKWSIVVNLQSTMAKTLSDAVKGVVQKF
jgi:type III secretion protein F